MRTGISNGIYTGIDDGIEKGVYTGVNDGIDQGTYYEKLLNNRIVTNGLQLYYDPSNPLSYNRSGITVNDLTTNANDGSLLNGVGFNALNYGQFVFDGINDSINAGDTNSIRFGSGSLTISMWVFLPDLNTVGTVTTKRLQGGDFNLITISRGTAFVSGAGFDLNPSKKICFAFHTAGANSYVVNTVNDIADGKWKHITLVRNSLSITATLYVNLIPQPVSILINRGVGILTNISVPGRNWYISGLGDINAAYIRSNVMNYMLYNRALTFAEIQQNYLATKYRLNL